MSRLVPVLIALAIWPGLVRAQERKPDDPMARALFAPEIVLKYAGDIGLKPAQRQVIVDAIKKVQGDLVGLQLDMAEPAQELVSLLEQPQVDESQALTKVDRVLTLERELKRAQLSLLIKIKNALTKEQQEKLKLLRQRDSERSGGGSDEQREDER